MLNVIGMVLLTHQQVTFRLNFFAPYHGWDCCDTASAQFKAHNGQRQLDGELIIDSPWLFPVAASNLQGHTVHILDGICCGNKALVVGLAGVLHNFVYSHASCTYPKEGKDCFGIKYFYFYIYPHSHASLVVCFYAVPLQAQQCISLTAFPSNCPCGTSQSHACHNATALNEVPSHSEGGFSNDESNRLPLTTAHT